MNDGGTPLSSFKYIRIPGYDYVPSFTGHSLLLSSEIGVMFKVTLPDGVEADDSSYMEFAYSDGKSEVTQLIKEAEKVDGENSYRFECFINPMELADVITATFHYGSSSTIVNQYSAMEYITDVRTELSDNEKLISLVNALQNYGYYMQGSGWTDGNSHAEIPAVKALDVSSVEAAKAGVSDMAAVISMGKSGISNASFSLTLNSKTRINVFAVADDGITIESPEAEETVALEDGTKYRFTSEKIGVRNLDTVYTFTIQTSSGTAIVKASAMSYVNAVLNAYSFSEAKKYAMTAYYEYYLAAENYE